jgi:hypothetical protein
LSLITRWQCAFTSTNSGHEQVPSKHVPLPQSISEVHDIGIRIRLLCREKEGNTEFSELSDTVGN